MRKYYVNLILSLLFFNVQSFSQEASKYPPLKYVSQLRDINEYYLYANGGFHADWYVGYNNCWIVKLPPVKKDGFEKAYLGAKLGRAKLDKEMSPIEGKIYISISDRPSFSSDSGYFLADSSEIPKEPSENESVRGIDSAKWFWASIPLNKLNPEKENYAAIWSPSDNFVSSQTSPIIAAGYGEGEDDVWLNRSVKGMPPVGTGALETPVSGIKPAIAVKLIPKNEYKVIIKNFSAEISGDDVLVTFSVIGADVQKAWLELSYDKFEWQKLTGYLYEAPYSLTLKRSELPEDLFYLRVGARDNYENSGYSREMTIPALKKQQPETAPSENKSEKK